MEREKKKNHEDALRVFVGLKYLGDEHAGDAFRVVSFWVGRA